MIIVLGSQGNLNIIKKEQGRGANHRIPPLLKTSFFAIYFFGSLPTDAGVPAGLSFFDFENSPAFIITILL